MKPLLDARQIRARATQQSYSRGESYFRNGAITSTIRRGHELEGRCEGSEVAPYYVRATLDDDGNIENASCTCGYGYSGDCKHIVALLLAYLHQPENFEEAIPIDVALAKRTKDELITLIQRMVAHDPDLQRLVDRPVPRPSPPGEAIDLTPFRRELRQGFDHFNQWDDDSALSAVQSVAEAAGDFAAAAQWHNASAIYRTILEEASRAESYPVDDEGELILALSAVVDGLVECLEAPEIAADEHERRAVIEHLVDAYIWDVEQGGLGLGDGTLPDALFAHLKPKDVPTIRARVMAAQQQQQKREFGNWGAEAFAHFLMELDALDGTDPEETLQRLRAQGLHQLLFTKLLSLGHVDEAVDTVAHHLTSAYQRLLALPGLVEAGRGDVAIHLANETLRTQFDSNLAHWLDRQYQARGSRNDLFALRLWRMQQQASVDAYAVLKQAAEAIDAWARVRPDVLNELERKQNYQLLAQIFLHDQEWDAAWQTVERMAAQPAKPQMGWGLDWLAAPSIELEVAERSKEVRPHKAIPVFIQHARRQIEGRTRTHYHQAADYLATVRELYQKVGDEAAWRKLIGDIRQEFRRLPALQDELNLARL